MEDGERIDVPFGQTGQTEVLTTEVGKGTEALTGTPRAREREAQGSAVDQRGEPLGDRTAQFSGARRASRPTGKGARACGECRISNHVSSSPHWSRHISSLL
ncbi:hypothetical protein [Streptomyces inhibens]|uniref:hypothetical protein n=1 Tax=Streptomyces inhibens TaxID=2293571 RepID=UPI001C6EADA3|nr:hypothetical protein [Streptomyces inhibens]